MKIPDIEQVIEGSGRVLSLDELLARVTSPGQATWQDLPASPGVYAVCLPSWETRPFTADAGMARHADPADPAALRAKRDRILGAGPTDILYIGKAENLCKRVQQLVRFGTGRANNHRGGEWLWQLKGICEAKLWMCCCPGERPELLERKLLEAFRATHGDWPLANRK